MPNNEIVKEARSYLGVKWRHQGRTRFGIDCAGLIILVGRELKLMHYEHLAYNRLPEKTAFLHHFEDNMHKIGVTDLAEGVVAVFRQDRYPCHCGIVSFKYGIRHIIHAHAPRRKVIEEPFSPVWDQNLIAAFEYRRAH